MGYQLIITEKPSAARKISAALADKGVKAEKKRGIEYYTLAHKGREIVIVPAVGHLYGLRQTTKDWKYPVFNVEWAPSSEINTASSHTKKYLENIKTLAKDADEFVVATDLDIEGETIAYNIIRFACKQKDAKRMKFSTLTKQDLVKAYDNMSPTIIHGLANAGVTRHTLDFYWGINFSRALSTAVKKAGQYKILSAGRVQGPALHFLATREKEIQAFKPTPFWQIELVPKEYDFRAHFEEEKIWEEDKAKKIFSECEGKNATVTDVKKKEYKQKPPTPFNLTDLQVEAHKLFKMVPKETQAIAQDLYLAAAISYPRTSSQKLPPEIGYRAILEKLKGNKDFESKAAFLLAKKDSELIPNDGKKTDDAHPAIFPTGDRPTEMTPKKKKVYDLIVKRFFAVFGEAAVRESNSVFMIVDDKHNFIAEGKRTVKPNWFDLYEPYVKLEEVTLPEMTVGDLVDVEKFELLSKETQPPARYNESSIIKELERRNLGTKATRANIIENLYKRGYLQEKRIEVTDLGMKVVDTLDKFSPELISESLTRDIEGEMEKIEKDEQKPKTVLDRSEKDLIEMLTKFKDHEKDIGTELLGSVRSTQEQASILGECTKCGKGNLRIMRSKYGQFVGCSSYPDCKNIYPLPKIGMIQKTGKICPECGTPIVKVIRKGARPFEMCLDPKCKTKANWGKGKKTAAAKKADENEAEKKEASDKDAGAKKK